MRGNLHVRCEVGEKVEIISNPYLSLFFGQDPKEVAAIFKDYLEKPWYGFTKVVFAIPEGKDENLRIFKEVFMV